MRLARIKSFGRLYILIYFLTFLQTVYSQSELPIDEDPYLDPDGVESVNKNQRFKDDQGFLIGFLYGLHTALVFSPALSLAYYKESFTLGIEVSDSDKLEFWSKQKKDWLGPSRFGGTNYFAKYFFVKNVYILGAYEKRFAQLYNRSYDRTQKPKEQDDNTFKKKVAKARFNIDAETTVGSVGIGYMNVGRLGFMSIDIIRYSFLINQRADVEVLWETWSSPEIDSYEDLQKNIESRKEKWHDTLDSPSTLLITVGLFF